PPAGLPAYLQALYRTPLLTPEQESDLFRRYNYLKFKIAGLLDRYAADPVPADVFRTLQLWIADCERIKQRIVEANLRLVVSIAKKHVGVSDRFFEVVSDGNMSLIRAVERFDFTRGTRFSTYATWVIVKNYARRIPERWYAGARHMTGQDELLESTADPRPVEAHPADRRRVRERIAAALQQLAPREREIVAGHFGLGEGDGTLTLEQLGRRFGVTKERVRQIERRALGRLRELLDPSLAEWIAE
ncbi:MAG: sigma-70 family RNA polymerase sigma factor, partial [Planctomycetota bacterium]